MQIHITSNTRGANEKLRKLKASLTLTAMDTTVRKVAWYVHRRLLIQTPKKWTGQTRRNWKVTRQGMSNYSVWNKSDVMKWLEKGTKAHGPTTAKMLFIPLTRKAALAGARGVMRANRNSDLNAAFGVGGKNNRPFKPGIDFVFAKRVKGIKAMNIVRDYRPIAKGVLRRYIQDYVKKVVQTL